MTGLIGWWPLHETEGDTAYDLSGNENHGALKNDAESGVSGLTAITSYNFNGDDWDTEDRLEVPHQSYLSFKNTFSISLWCRPSVEEVDGEWLAALSKGRSSRDRNYQIWFDEDHFNLWARDETDSEWLDAEESNISRDTNQWYHVAAVCQEIDSGVIGMLYVDGDLVATDTIENDLVTNNDPLDISYYEQGNRYWSGNICDVRVYNRALSPSEIQELYRQGSRDLHKKSLSDGTDSGAVSRWKLEDGGADGSTAVDTWNDNDGTINGAAFTDNSVRNDGRALQFDGDGDYMETDSEIHIGTSNWTVSSWYYPMASDDYGHIFTSSSSQGNFACKVNNDTLEPYFFSNDGRTRADDVNKSLNIGSWYHLVYRYDGSELRIYLNGEYIGGDSFSGLNISSDTFQVQGGNEEYVQAIHDDVRIFNRALEPWEVFELYRWGSLGKDMRKELVNKKGGGQ